MFKTINGELSWNGGAHARNQTTHIADCQYVTRVSLYASIKTARCAPYYVLRLPYYALKLQRAVQKLGRALPHNCGGHFLEFGRSLHIIVARAS